jgi:hypothetical protein
LQLRDRWTRKRIQPDQEDGQLEKRLYSERPPREEYDLTEAGYDYLPVLGTRAIRGLEVSTGFCAKLPADLVAGELRPHSRSALLRAHGKVAP